MAQAPVAPDLHQALDVLRALAAQVTLDDEVVHGVAQLADLLLGQVADVRVGVDPGSAQQLVRRGAANAVNVGQADLDALVQGDVDPGDSCHQKPSPGAACAGGSDRSLAPHHGGE